MPGFRDLKNREWELRVTASAARRLKDEEAVDLFDVMTKGEKAQVEFFQSLMLDADKAIAIAYIVCLPIAQEKGISADDFLDAIDGDVVRKLQPALMKGIADFFPKGDREVAQRIAEQLPKELDRLTTKKVAQVSKLNIEELMTEAANRLIAGGNTSSDSSDTPEPDPTT